MARGSGPRSRESFNRSSRIACLRPLARPSCCVRPRLLTTASSGTTSPGDCSCYLSFVGNHNVRMMTLSPTLSQGRGSIFSLLALTGLLLAACVAGGRGDAIPVGSTMEVVLLETTDLHQNVLSYDYYKLAEDKSIGLERTATLIGQARARYANTLLFDDGDTIQGTVLGDYQAAVKPVACDEMLGIYKVMSHLKYDAGAIGNHEFNYGLAYLSQVTGRRFNVAGFPDPAQPKACRGPDFPLVLANVSSLKDKQPVFKPYAIVTRIFKATRPDGSAFDAH